VLPEARVVYVDHDPMVAAYSGPLLAADGTTTLVTADWRDPGAVLGDPGLRRLIDLADGLELVPPYTGADGVMTYAGLWGAEDIEAADTEGSRGIYCGVARRP